MIAFIPARAGSRRIPGKNFKLLAGHPLIAYTIASAKASGVFDRIVVCTDDLQVNLAACDLGVEVHARQASTDDEPDIAWLRPALARCPTEAFAILRCTSPFRTSHSIKAAWLGLQSCPWADSTRAVTPWTGPHPAKMWYPQGKRIDRIRPVWEGAHPDGTPWHSSPTQTLKPVYVQTAGLEIGWTARTVEKGTIAGENVLPYIVRGPEALDINTEADFAEAERIAAEQPDLLPRIEVAA